MSDALVDAVFARSEGNPLYVEEYVRALIETNRIAERDGRWRLLPGGEVDIPPTLHGLVAARLDRLPNDVRRVVQIASVIGRTFSSSALGVLHSAPSSTELRRAVQTGIVDEAETWEPGRGAIYRFRHVLFHEVAYGTIAKADRARLHDRYRDWCESPAAGRGEVPVEVLAHHADRAYELATELRSADAPRLARIAFDRARAAAVRARDQGDLRASLALWSRAREIGTAVGVTDADRTEVEGEVLLSRAALQGDDASWREIEELLPRARSLGPSAVLVHLLIAAGWRTYTFQFDVDRSARLMDEALAVARALGDEELITHAMLQVPVVAGARGDREAVRRAHEETLAYAKTHGVTREMPACLRAVAEGARRSGDFTRAATLIDEAVRLAHDSGAKAAEFEALMNRAELVAWADPTEHAIDVARELKPLAETLATRDAYVRYLDALGWASSEAGDLEGARRAQEEALAMSDPARTPYDFVYTATNLIFTLLALGDLGAARRIRTQIEPFDIPQQNQRAMRVLVDAALREAEGDLSGAEELYRRSIAIFEQATTAPTRLHWAQQRFAALLLLQGRKAEARQLLEQVHRFFSDPLAAQRRARVGALLRQCDAARVAGSL